MARPLIIRRRVDAIKAFNEIEVDLKKMLQHLRHETNKHEPAYFAAVHNLSDKQLTNFSGTYLFLGMSWCLLGLWKPWRHPRSRKLPVQHLCLESFISSRGLSSGQLSRHPYLYSRPSTSSLNGSTRHLADSHLGDDLKEVRVGESAYGTHLFGKVLLPDSDPSHAYPEK